MAHIKVVRRSMRPEEWTDLRFQWLKRSVYEEKYEITNVWIRDARQISECEYEFYSEEYRELKKGDLYFSPDGTAFIKAEVHIPEQFQGKELWLSLKTAAEIMVKVNGTYVGGLDPNRDRILLTPYIKSQELHFEMEGYNRSKPDDERNPDALSIRGCRQIFEGLYLSTVNHSVQDLVYDLELLLDIAKSEYFNEDYQTFLNRELSKALDFIDFDTMEGVDCARDYIEKVIYQNTDYKGSGDVALIAHSHLDIAYYWRRIHAVQKNARTVLIQMRLMDRYPEFKYAHTQAYTYELLEKYYPELFAELKEKIAQGKFEPVGAMYVEPDCNIPNCESLIRQCLYGQSYFRETFGLTVNNCWLPDVFGNSWILPQIMKKSGVEYFVSNKMSTWNDTNRFPHNNFIWKGIDGSCVYASVPPTHFISWNMPSQIQENWESYQDKQVGGQTMSMFGYGDGGSGVTEEMLELMDRFKKLSIMPKTEHMTGTEFLERNLKDNNSLQTWDGELYLEMHRGTFTTKSKMKRENRKLEFSMREAEIAAALRMMGDHKEYPAEQLMAGYKKLLINQFHDILPGSHIHPVYEDAMADYENVDKLSNTIIGTGEMYFNSLNFPRTTMTFVENEEGSYTRCGKQGEWVIPNIPAFGRMASLFKDKKEEEQDDWFNMKDLTISTPHYVIQFAKDGSIESFYDKELEREWVDEEFNKLHIYEDNPGVYDAWDILPNYTDKEIDILVTSPLSLQEYNEVFAELKVSLATKKSTWTMLIRVFREFRGIEVEHLVDWQEKHKLAKMNFSCNVLARELVCDTSAGFIKRETHKNTTWQQARFEVCHHKWCDMSESDGGIALINEGKYGVGIDENLMSLSLLRATIRPDITSDIGNHNFCYMILPHKGNHLDASINRIAYEYNVPLLKPELSEEFSSEIKELLSVISNPMNSLFLQSIKRSEDGKRIVFRLTEQDGRRGKLNLPYSVEILNLLEDKMGEATEIVYKPFEIVTFGVSVSKVG